MILTETFPMQPPWEIDRVDMCTELFHHNKKEILPHILHRIFLEHLQSHIDSFHLYTDGSKTEGGVGYAFHCSGKSFQNRISPISSIFTAELLAIKDAINYTETSTPSNKITIFSDSRSALQAITNFNTNPIVQHIQDLLISSNKSFHLCWVPSHVGVAGNDRADELARSSIESLDVCALSIPRADYKLHVKKLIRERWQATWTATQNNKLHEILPVVPKKYVSSHPRALVM